MPDSSPEAAAQAAEDMLDTAVGTLAETPNTTDEGSGSSPAKTAGTMLDAVQAALEPKEASPASQEPGSEAKADPDAEEAEGAAEEELSEAELKAQSWKTQQRFKKLSSTVKHLTTENEGLKTKATDYDRIVGNITQAGLDNKELDELVEVGSLLKRDPQKALQRLVPIVQALQGVVGDIIPSDLQERVRLGYISEADARELNRARAGERLSRQNAERVQTETQAERQQREVTNLVNSSISATEAWEKQQASKDPDWHQKRTQVAEQVQLAIVKEAQKRNQPYFPTAEESVKLAKAALKTIEDRIAAFRPKPNEIRPASGGASPRSKPAAKNTLDAINNALG